METVQRMLSVISHRGPDDEFSASGKGFCLGVKRLSIIDLDHGRQPISNEDGTVCVAQNGEIYNFAELRCKLGATHQFKTRSDTEVLLHLYEEFGDDFVNHIDGMFAISIWDARKKVGVLVRDRIGKKPLYYCVRSRRLYFASEIKSLLQMRGLKKRINLKALHHYLSLKHVPCPLSIFAGIYQVPPASMLVFHPGSRPKLKRYWKLDFSSQQKLSENEIVDCMAARLELAVRKRLVSDVPVGFFLSGGVDSGILVAIAARSSRSPVKTFTLTYTKEDLTEGKRLDRENARRIAKTYGTEHHEEFIELSDFSQELPRIIRHFDEPFSGVTSTFFLSRLISKHVKVAVSGDGADEEFGSYLSHRLASVVHNLLDRGETPSDYRNLGPIKNLEDLKGFAEKEEWKWRYRLLVFSDEEKQQLYSARLKKLTRGYSTLRLMQKYFSNLTAKDTLNRMLEAEFRSFLPDQVLTYVDRLSMAHSLEIRAPYLDREFMELAAQIPGELKIRDGETKLILKKLALRYLPKDVVYRQKEGFVIPTDILMKKLESYVRAVLSRKNLRQHNFFNIDYVDRLLDLFYHGTATEEMKQTLSYKILNLLSFQVWYDLYMASE